MTARYGGASGTSRWFSSAGGALAEPEAQAAAGAVRETRHLHDGLIQRQVWQRGSLVRQDDLNAEGRPIRRLSYQHGRLARREYFGGDGRLVSTELFDAQGFITRSIGPGSTQWDYERGVPVRCRRGETWFVKRGDRWIAQR